MATLTDLVEALDVLLESLRASIRDATLVPLEDRMTKALAKAFRAQGKVFLKKFKTLEDRWAPNVAEDQWQDLLEEAQLETRHLFIAAFTKGIRPALRAGIRHAAEGVNRDLQEAYVHPLTEALPETPISTVLGIRFDLENPRAVSYLSEHGADLVTRIDETTRGYIRTLVVQGASEGLSYSDMAKRLTERYQEFAVPKPQQHIDSRAHLIAVTEVGQAYSQGNLLVGQSLRDAGLQMEKAWDTMGDDRVSEGCQANEAAGWIPLEDPFPSGDMRPLRFPGCRCDMKMRRVEGARAPEATAEKAQGRYYPKAIPYAPDPERIQTIQAQRLEEFKMVRRDDSYSVEEAQERLKTLYNDQLAGIPVSIRAPNTASELILQEGRFKSQFESGASGGILDRDYRATAENRGMGIPLDITPTDRPIYGYIRIPGSDHDSASAYGDFEWVLRSNVDNRVTISVGDSLRPMGNDALLPAPKGDLRLEAFASVGDVDRVLTNGNFRSIQDYVEAQIHGGVTLRDVDHVIIHMDAIEYERKRELSYQENPTFGFADLRPPAQRAVLALEEKGIAIEYQFTY